MSRVIRVHQTTIARLEKFKTSKENLNQAVGRLIDEVEAIIAEAIMTGPKPRRIKTAKKRR